MIKRRIATELSELLDSTPAVALLGPRQVGKTTLALAVAEQRPSIYLWRREATAREREDFD